MPAERFYDALKAQQITWAASHGISDAERETSLNRPWVLKPSCKARNLHDPTWWRFIAGKEHQWARALTSSQCFAVNLFAPLVEHRPAARAAFQRLVPDHPLVAGDEVVVALEHTPDSAPAWLGEARQPTQVDVIFTVRRGALARGHLLVEVKLGESEFGSCRGARPGKGNPDPSRCKDLAAVLRDPALQCWLAEAEGRRYWTIITGPGSTFHMDRLPPGSMCPFRGGLYQLMRNQVLAEALVAHTEAEWAELALCIHPDNRQVRELKVPVGGSTDIPRAFAAVSAASIRTIEPADVLAATVAAAPALSGWAESMRERYRH